MARSHAVGDLDLCEAGGAAPIGELASELAAFERGDDAQGEVGVVLRESVDECDGTGQPLFPAVNRRSLIRGTAWER